MLLSRTNFFVDMSGKISSRWRRLSTKQWSGNKCSDLMFWPKFKLWITWWIIGTGWVCERQVCRCIRLTVKPIWRLNIFWFLNVSFLFQNSTLLCRKNSLCRHVVFSQNCCFVANFVDKALVYCNVCSICDKTQPPL